MGELYEDRTATHSGGAGKIFGRICGSICYSLDLVYNPSSETVRDEQSANQRELSFQGTFRLSATRHELSDMST